MYDFGYGYVKVKYNEKAEVCYMDEDFHWPHKSKWKIYT